MKIISKTSASLLSAAVFAGAVLCNQAQAVPISGAITFKGGVTLDTGNVGTATAVTAFVDTAVESRDGSYAGIALQAPATFSAPWAFAAGKPALWTVGGFTFNLTSSSVAFQSPTALVVSGIGSVSGNGFDPTATSWNFSTQTPGAQTPGVGLVFSFSAAAGSPPGGPGVPDGGMTAMMLGGSLVLLGFVRRQLAGH